MASFEGSRLGLMGNKGSLRTDMFVVRFESIFIKTVSFGFLAIIFPNVTVHNSVSKL